VRGIDHSLHRAAGFAFHLLHKLSGTIAPLLLAIALINLVLTALTSGRECIELNHAQARRLVLELVKTCGKKAGIARFSIVLSPVEFPDR
jgi:hypothetical protein